MKNKNSKPVFVISRSFPPSVEAGGSMVAYHLFQKIDPIDFMVLSGRLFPQDNNLTVSAKTWSWDIRPRKFQYTKFGLVLLPVLLLKILYIIIFNRPRHILIFFPFDLFAIAGWIGAYLLRMPFSIYFFDTWEESQNHKLQQWAAKIFEHRLIDNADDVFVISPALKRHFDQKYKINSTTILHPIPFTHFYPKVRYSDTKKETYRIVYTGNISRLNSDSVIRLVQAVRETKKYNFEIAFFTGQSNKEVAYILGLEQKDPVKIQFVSSNEIPGIQQMADILFVGLSFVGLDQTTMQTTFPTKFVEYLMAGQPILAHCPRDSFLAEYIEEWQCAELVDMPDVEAIKRALEMIVDQPDRALRKIENAIRVAKGFEDRIQIEKLTSKLHLRTRQNG